MYCHKALLDVLLNYNSDTKATNLASIGVGDDAFQVALAKNSKPFTLCGSLQFDFFDQPKYLIPGVNVNIKLHRNANRLIYMRQHRPLNQNFNILALNCW